MSLTLSQQRAMDAFDVEIQAMLESLRRMPKGKTVHVWMAPTRLLYRSQETGAKLVNDFPYNCDVPRADFWDDCQALAAEQGWDIRPARATA